MTDQNDSQNSINSNQSDQSGQGQMSGGIPAAPIPTAVQAPGENLDLPEPDFEENEIMMPRYYPKESLSSNQPNQRMPAKSDYIYSTDDSKIKIEEIKDEPSQFRIGSLKKRALTKLAVFVLIIVFFGSAATTTITRFYIDKVYRAVKGVLYSAPLKTTVWQSYGSVPEAALVLPLKTPNGQIDQEFLLDTGAVVSSLPREMAEKMGYDLAKLQRQTFKGFGNTISFAYNAEMIVHFNNKEITLPVVFTEAQGSKALLGRKGLFDKFTILVDHKSKLVEIRE
jgi:predicted aspartyl protease